MGIREPSARAELSDDLTTGGHTFVRVWFESGDGVEEWDIDGVGMVNWHDDYVAIAYTPDMDDEIYEEQSRYIHINREKVVGIKHIQTPMDYYDGA